MNLGFNLTTFLSGYIGSYGPLAQGIAPNGDVITGSLLNRKIYVFHDSDNQQLTDAVSATDYTCTTGNCNISMTTAGGEVYGGQAAGGVFLHFASDGSSMPIPNLQAAGIFAWFGMWGNPADGHLIASTTKGLMDIDPVTGTSRTINAQVFPDGVSVSPDGSTMYVENAGLVQSYSIATGALVRSFPFVGHGPDGTGVISGGPLDGDVIVNNNDGTVALLDPSKPDGDPLQYRTIASGGTRGDFVSPDVGTGPNNGTLFLSQNEEVARLSCGPGCSIGGGGGGGDGSGGGGVPEPSTFALFGSGMGLVALFRRAPRLSYDGSSEYSVHTRSSSMGNSTGAPSFAD